MRILLTGANGASGKNLARHLAENTIAEILLTDLSSDFDASIKPCDLADYPSVRKLMSTTNPERVFHFAGTFSNEYSVDYTANVLATRHILEAILELGIACRVLLIGSAAEYGIVRGSDNPVPEDHELRPVSIYGLTKAMQTQLMRFYVDRYHMDIVMARSFNLNGKGMSRKLFIGTLHAQIEEYRSGSATKIVLGRLSDKRDYIDMAKAIECYELIMDSGKPGEVYHVGSGHPILMEDLLKKVLAEYGLPLSIVESSDGGGVSDVPEVYADMSKTLALSAARDV